MFGVPLWAIGLILLLISGYLATNHPTTWGIIQKIIAKLFGLAWEAGGEVVDKVVDVFDGDDDKKSPLDVPLVSDGRVFFDDGKVAPPPKNDLIPGGDIHVEPPEVEPIDPGPERIYPMVTAQQANDAFALLSLYQAQSGRPKSDQRDRKFSTIRNDIAEHLVHDYIEPKQIKGLTDE